MILILPQSLGDRYRHTCTFFIKQSHIRLTTITSSNSKCLPAIQCLVKCFLELLQSSSSYMSQQRLKCRLNKLQSSGRNDKGKIKLMKGITEPISQELEIYYYTFLHKVNLRICMHWADLIKPSVESSTSNNISDWRLFMMI